MVISLRVILSDVSQKHDDAVSLMLALRLIDPNDYLVLDDGHPVGRIRLASERSPAIWLWTVTVTIPGGPFGDAKTIDEAKARFKSSWLAFKNRVGDEALMKA